MIYGLTQAGVLIGTTGASVPPVPLFEVSAVTVMLCGVTLVDDIITGASGSTPVTTLLRQVKVLSARPHTASLASWVEWELSGDGDGEDVPSYRGPYSNTPLGHFVGPFGLVEVTEFTDHDGQHRWKRSSSSLAFAIAPV